MFKRKTACALWLMILVSCTSQTNTEIVTEQEPTQDEQVFPPVQDVNYIPNSELWEE